nr:hypothetical protein [Tanacetum cinerariifolium]
MFWLGQEETWGILDGVVNPFLIISFDITSERFSEIRLPSDLAKNDDKKLTLSKRRDSLILKKWDEINQNHGVWVMVNNKDRITFEKLFTINCPERSEILIFRMNDEPVIQMYNDRYEFDAVFGYDTESQKRSSVIAGNLSSIFKDPFSYNGHLHGNTILANCNKLPLDIFLDVLKKLPLKSLLRFKAACKPWNSHISSSSFISEYQKSRLSNKVLLGYKDNDEETEFESISDDDSFPRKKDKMFLPTSVGLDKAKPVVFGSINGLFCFANYTEPKRSPAVVLWNPTIGKLFAISRPK